MPAESWAKSSGENADELLPLQLLGWNEGSSICRKSRKNANIRNDDCMWIGSGCAELVCKCCEVWNIFGCCGFRADWKLEVGSDFAILSVLPLELKNPSWIRHCLENKMCMSVADKLWLVHGPHNSSCLTVSVKSHFNMAALVCFRVVVLLLWYCHDRVVGEDRDSGAVYKAVYHLALCRRFADGTKVPFSVNRK